ncbi:DEAD/DEAH box helicase [Oscillibacter sp.]|uniref:DEAD/DEAH box helicase n=1 Tax=Oscillibacter sp. TaxID=1945593 RepID=UPI002602AE03|nr:DEAD/DEAH box helicase [Oscillibacter sp.]
MFSQLDLSPALLDAVTSMGFQEATDIQAQAIPVIRAGADVLARSQTGTGKTVAFGIPAVECVDEDAKGVQVLVLSPTRELAHQCGDEIRKLARNLPRVKTADVLGGGDYRSQFKNLQEAAIVIGTPGRIMDHMRRGTLKLDRLKMVVLDEADEMLNMGFREDIEFILQDAPAQRQTVLFSATVPEEILAIAERFQRDPVHIEINRGQATLTEISQTYADVPMHQKADALSLLLHYYHPNRAIIFSNTKSMVDELTERLSAEGFSVEGLHGDMKQLQRTTVMNGFKKGRISILVATDVAARGIDVSDIDFVFNYDIPKETDSYVHRIGRTGRAGRSGTAVTLCCGKRQIMQMQRLAREIKSTLNQIPLPTVEEIDQANQTRTLNFLEQALAEAPQSAHEDMVSQLMARGHSAESIAATVLGLAFHQETGKLKNISVSTANPPSAKAAKVSLRARRPMAELVINTGFANRVAVNHIVGAITEQAGVSSLDLGKIEISETFTTVSVPAELLDDIVVSMRGCKICGKPVHVMPLAEQFPHKKQARPFFKDHRAGKDGPQRERSHQRPGQDLGKRRIGRK